MTQNHSHHLKRLQHNARLDRPFPSHHRHVNDAADFRSSGVDDEEPTRESMQKLSEHGNRNDKKLSRPFKPDPHRARRGGGRARDRHWHPSVCLPKRAINYDLAESFMDHSTNPLSSDLYKVRFHHSNKQWPNGRFMSYKEKLDKLDGNIVEISCTRTFALVPKRKKMIEIQPVDPPSIVPPPILPVDPVVQEQKKKQVDKQTHFYANLFGCGKIPRLSSANPTKKTYGPSTASSVPVSLLGENREDQQC